MDTKVEDNDYSIIQRLLLSSDIASLLLDEMDDEASFDDEELMMKSPSASVLQEWMKEDASMHPLCDCLRVC